MTLPMNAVLLFAVTFIGTGTQASPDLPDLKMSYEEFNATNGMGYEEHERCLEIAKIVKSRYLKQGETLPPDTDASIGDILLTYEQWQAYEAHASSRSLSKRKILDFITFPTRKWDSPIHYFIHPVYSASDKILIRQALDLWEEETCLRFLQITIPTTEPFLFFNPGDGCNSFVGQIVVSGPQVVNLKIEGCMSINTILHEVGHAIGFAHEHSRTDRDTYVDILDDNINSTYLFAFDISNELDQSILTAVPYDHSSMMHYSLTAFTIADGIYSIRPLDPLYVGNFIGHPRMTFFDAKTANLVYCNGVCPSSSLTCLNSGYEDPNNCGNCRCLEGYMGQTCSDTDPGNHGHLSGCPRAGKILISPGSGTQCLDVSLGRDVPVGTFMECNWHIQTPNLYENSIDFWFTSMSLTISTVDSCFDFVEVKYLDMFARGPRLCGYTPPAALNSPTNFLTSDAETTPTPGEIMVNFGSRYSNNPNFKFCFRATPRCRITPIGNVFSSAVADHALPKNKKSIVAKRGADNDPCKARVVVRTDGLKNVQWSAVNFGLNPVYPTKYFRNYAFDLQGNLGAWERGWQVEDEPALMSFPYAGWNDGSVYVTVEQTGYASWKVEAICQGKLLLEYTFVRNSGFRTVRMKFGDYSDWTGECF